MFKLPEAWFDIICVVGNITIGKGDPEILQVGEEVGHDCAEGAVELHTVFDGFYKVDGNGIYGGRFSCIENELVLPSFLPSFLDKVVLWGEEDVWREPGNPGWERDNGIVALLFVHGLYDCIEFLHDGWVVAVSPIGHEFFPSSPRWICLGTRLSWRGNRAEMRHMTSSTFLFVAV